MSTQSQFLQTGFKSCSAFDPFCGGVDLKFSRVEYTIDRPLKGYARCIEVHPEATRKSTAQELSIAMRLGDSPQRRKERKGGAEFSNTSWTSNQISAPPLRSLRLCGEASFRR